MLARHNKLRGIKDCERPLCPTCGKPLVWTRTDTYYEKIYGWDYDCECIDTDRFETDHVFKFTP